MTVKGHEVSLWDDENLLELDSGEVAQPCEYPKPLTCALSTVNFVVCELYLNKKDTVTASCWGCCWQ